MYHPNDINDDSDVEEEYYDENVELEEDQPQPVRPVVQEERPLTFVLGKTLATSGRYKFSKVKRPVLFYGTKTGWKSISFVKGLTNEYVSNETWDFIENEWLRCDMKDAEVFWDEEEFSERLNNINEKIEDYTSYSEAYEKYGDSLIEEVEKLKSMAISCT